MKNIILTFILIIIIIIFYILNNYLIENFAVVATARAQPLPPPPPPKNDPKYTCNTIDGKCYNNNDVNDSYFPDGKKCITNECWTKSSSVGGNGCFSKDSKIKLEDGSFKNISEVKNGDRILSYSPQKDEFVYSPVVYIIHEKNDDFSTFIELKTEKNKNIRMKTNHLIPFIKDNKIELISADKIVINDIIKTVDGDEQIISIENSYDTGLYTLITQEEYIVVDNIVVSPFAISHIMGQFYYSMYRALFKLSPKLLHSDVFRFYHENAVKIFNSFIK